MAHKKLELDDIFRRAEDEKKYPPCCAIRDIDTCETIEDTFKDIQKFIKINDVISIKFTPSRNWLICASRRLSCEEVLTRCKRLFKPHRIIGVEEKGRTWNGDGFKYLLHLNHRVNKPEIDKILDKQRTLKVEQWGLIQSEEYLYWRNYVTKHFPLLASAAWSVDEREKFQPVTEEKFLTNERREKFVHRDTSTTIPVEKKENFIEELLCRICFENQFDHAILPCGHTICLQCFEKCESGCPHCRGKVLGRVKLHF